MEKSSKVTLIWEAVEQMKPYCTVCPTMIFLFKEVKLVNHNQTTGMNYS